MTAATSNMHLDARSGVGPADEGRHAPPGEAGRRASIAIRARFYLFGTGVNACAGCYGPPHVIDDRAFLYRYQLQGVGNAGRLSPPVCGQACVAAALRREAHKAPPLPPLATALLAKARRDFAEEHRVAREAAAAARMERLRALGTEAVAVHMAEIIVARAAGQEACARRDLVAAGFTEEEIVRLGPAAIARAATQAPDLRG